MSLNFEENKALLSEKGEWRFVAAEKRCLRRVECERNGRKMRVGGARVRAVIIYTGARSMRLISSFHLRSILINELAATVE